MLVTVALPTYNRAAHLSTALQMILHQAYPDFELLVCDDGSRDETPDVVSRFRDPRLRYIRQEVNSGIPEVMNRLLVEARGDAIVFLHDHDIFDERLLGTMVELLKAHPSVGFVNPGVAWIDEDGANYAVMEGLGAPVMSGQELVRQILTGDSFACPVTACALVRRAVYQAAGAYYDPRFGFVSDVDLWLRLGMCSDVAQVSEPLLTCRRRGVEHPFGGVEWRLLRWIVEVHRVNIERFPWSDEEERDWARARLVKKARWLYGKSLLVAASLGDPDAFEAGLHVMRNEPGAPALAARGLLRAPRARRAAVALATILRRALRRTP